jgi:hypothetical protein
MYQFFTDGWFSELDVPSLFYKYVLKLQYSGGGNNESAREYSPYLFIYKSRLRL